MLTKEELTKANNAAQVAYNKLPPDSQKKMMHQLGATDEQEVVDKIVEFTNKLFEQYKKIHKTDESFTFFANNQFAFKRTGDRVQQQSNDGFQACFNYMVGSQEYSISTLDACAGMPVLGKLMGIYRHGYITIQDSPFYNITKNTNEILELNPGGQTDEDAEAAKKANLQKETKVVPGFVTFALHLAGKELLDSGEYSLRYYRPWNNDCQTYTKHAQERMNELLPQNMKQKLIKHFRFFPVLKQKDIDKVKQDFGIALDTKRVGKDIEVFGQGLAKNPRNVRVERKRNSDVKKTDGYWSWLKNQFVLSMSERLEMGSLYGHIKRSAEQALRKSFNEIDKTDIIIRQISLTMANQVILMAKEKQNIELPHLNALYNQEIECTANLARLSNSLLAYQKSPSEAALNEFKAAIVQMESNFDKYIESLENIKGCEFVDEAVTDVNKYRIKIRQAFGINLDLTVKLQEGNFSATHMEALANANWKKKGEFLSAINTSINDDKSKKRMGLNPIKYTTPQQALSPDASLAPSKAKEILQVTDKVQNDLVTHLTRLKGVNQLHKYAINNFEQNNNLIKINMGLPGDKIAEVQAVIQPESKKVAYIAPNNINDDERKIVIQNLCKLAVDAAKPGSLFNIPSNDEAQIKITQEALDNALTEKYPGLHVKGNFKIPEASICLQHAKHFADNNDFEKFTNLIQLSLWHSQTANGNPKWQFNNNELSALHFIINEAVVKAKSNNYPGIEMLEKQQDNFNKVFSHHNVAKKTELEKDIVALTLDDKYKNLFMFKHAIEASLKVDKKEIEVESPILTVPESKRNINPSLK